MTYPKGNRGECMRHSRIRCGECEYVAELEEKNRQLIRENNQVNDELIEEYKKNKRYKQALEFYADEKNYDLQKHDDIYDHYFTEVSEDEGEKARQALEVSE